MLIDYKNLSEN